jgi:hypothetical protein
MACFLIIALALYKFSGKWKRLTTCSPSCRKQIEPAIVMAIKLNYISKQTSQRRQQTRFFWTTMLQAPLTLDTTILVGSQGGFQQSAIGRLCFPAMAGYSFRLRSLCYGGQVGRPALRVLRG